MTSSLTPLAQPLPLQDSRALHSALGARLGTLSFPAFCHLIRLLLYRCGYASVQLIEPITTPDGGARVLYEGLIATSHTDLSTSLTLVRVKQATSAPVSRRFVDQLRGAMLRVGADQGLLLAAGNFSELARGAARQTGLSPVRLVEGRELLRLLVAHRLGLRHSDYPDKKQCRHKARRKARHNEPLRWEVDAGFFDQLEVRAAKMPFYAPR